MRSLFRFVASAAVIFYGTIYGTFALCMLGVAVCAIWIMYLAFEPPVTMHYDIFIPLRIGMFLTIAAGILATLLGGLFGRFR